eukprot:665543-Pyramimonas_sp.AAC.1
MFLALLENLICAGHVPAVADDQRIPRDSAGALRGVAPSLPGAGLQLVGGVPRLEFELVSISNTPSNNRHYKMIPCVELPLCAYYLWTLPPSMYKQDLAWLTASVSLSMRESEHEWVREC